MKAAIFGAKGFVGPHLENLLLDVYDVVTFDLKDGQDIRSYEQVRSFLDATQPDYIFNLAGMAYVPESNYNPQRAIDVHVKGTVNILEAVKQLGLHPKILLTSTSEEYGYSNQKEVVTEDSPTRPTTVYGATKNAMTRVAEVYINQGMHIVITRAFNHVGTGKGEQYADSSFAKRIVQIERGELDVLLHGNLGVTRNYTSVQDIVRAYALAIHAQPGVYNVCSDNNITIEKLLGMFIINAKVPIKTEVDPKFWREEDTTFQKPSWGKLYEATTWEPVVILEEEVERVLQEWRERIL